MTSTAGRGPDRATRPVWLRSMLAVGVVVGVAASVLLVASEDLRWVKLAGVAALWVALLAAFAVARSRREARMAEMRVEESKHIYELELRREVAARREFEVKVVESARAEADAARRDELAQLREQLELLTVSLTGLFDGALQVERLTLSAEATRVRPILGAGRQRLAGGAAFEVQSDRGGDTTEPGVLVEVGHDETAHSDGVPVAQLLAAFATRGLSRQRHRSDN